MKSKLYKAAVLLLLAALLTSVFVFGWSQYVEFASRRALHAVSQHAREITAVEVLSITSASDSGASGSYRLPYDRARYAVTARHTLTGEEAAELVRTWSRVRFIEGLLAGCHSPGFVLRFLAGRRTIFEVAVCFECENVSYSPAPFESALIQMSTKRVDPKSGMEDLKTLLTSFNEPPSANHALQRTAPPETPCHRASIPKDAPVRSDNGPTHQCRCNRARV